MDAAQFEAWVDTFEGISRERRGPDAWLLRGVVEDKGYVFMAQLSEGTLTVLHRFQSAPIRLEEDGMERLLDFNADFYNFRFALDPTDRLYLVGSWPAKHLTRDQVNFMVVEFLLHLEAMEGEAEALVHAA